MTPCPLVGGKRTHARAPCVRNHQSPPPIPPLSFAVSAGLLHALVVFLLFVKLRGGNTIGGARLDGPTVALGAIFLEAGNAL